MYYTNSTNLIFTTRLCLLTIFLTVCCPEKEEVAVVVHDYYKSCYYKYIECLGKDDTRFVDSYSLNFQNFQLFCLQHEVYMLQCLRSKLNILIQNITEALDLCSVTLGQSKWTNEHQKRTILQSKLIIKYLCNHYKEYIIDNPACFHAKLEYCIRATSNSKCHNNCHSGMTVNVNTLSGKLEIPQAGTPQYTTEFGLETLKTTKHQHNKFHTMETIKHNYKKFSPQILPTVESTAANVCMTKSVLNAWICVCLVLVYICNQKRCI